LLYNPTITGDFAWPVVSTAYRQCPVLRSFPDHGNEVDPCHPLSGNLGDVSRHWSSSKLIHRDWDLRSVILAGLTRPSRVSASTRSRCCVACWQRNAAFAEDRKFRYKLKARFERHDL